MRMLLLSCIFSFASADVLSNTLSTTAGHLGVNSDCLGDGILGNTEPSTRIRNANQIFNAIHGAMRQWDNSWNHNGMSFFKATVPGGVQFYHGTGQQESIKGMEWLAFEPEHAIGFAHGRWRPPKAWSGKESQYEQLMHSLRHEPSSRQHILSEDVENQPPPPFNDTGFLHFYRTLHPLNLIYIDGQSAGKTPRGTVDSQDYVLRLGLNSTPVYPFGDYERANDMCGVAHNDWDERIDGFIRMETGFEIILCNFEKHLRLERVQTVKNSANRKRVAGELVFRFYRAIADRFHGIGGSRVDIDYANFVSAFQYDFGGKLFVNDSNLEQALPRLQNQSDTTLGEIQTAVTDMVINPCVPTVNTDWQSIAEMIVQRYASPLQYLLLPDLSGEGMEIELNTLLWPFISDQTNKSEIITSRCIGQFLPTTWHDTLAGQVVHQVGSRVCGDVVKAFLMLSKKDGEREVHSVDQSSATRAPHQNSAYGEVYKSEVGSREDSNAARQAGLDSYPSATSARELIRSLVDWLDWPIWYECNPSCGYAELCIIPIWPLTSSSQDRKQPTCKNTTQFAEDRWKYNPDDDYWCSPTNNPWSGCGFPPRTHR